MELDGRPRCRRKRTFFRASVCFVPGLFAVKLVRTHAYVPLTHSVPQANNTPTLPLRISPWPPHRFKPPLTSFFKISLLPFLLLRWFSGRRAEGSSKPLETMSEAPFWRMVVFCNARASCGHRVSGSALVSICCVFSPSCFGKQEDVKWRCGRSGLTIFSHNRLNSMMFGVKTTRGVPGQSRMTEGSF